MRSELCSKPVSNRVIRTLNWRRGVMRIAFQHCVLAGLAGGLASCALTPATSVPPLGATAPHATEARPTAAQVATAPTGRPTLPAQPTDRPSPTLAPPTTVPTSVPTTAPTPVLMPYEEREQIFEEIWRTVKEHYLYSDFHGVDWDAVHDQFADRLQADQTRVEFYDTMVELITQLNDQHSRFLPPAAAQTENATISNSDVTVGIGVLTKPRPDGAFIQIVYPDSPAARVGLEPRDRIIGVDGRPYRAEDGNLLG